MTDAFEVTGEFAPAEILTSTVSEASSPMEPQLISNEVDIEETIVEPEVPNGFVELGLAPELVQACKDLGYTQPTTVQKKTIPLALPTSNAGKKDGFIDLMVSSQTGSGKTAAFLLPVLHTLLTQLSTSKPVRTLQPKVSPLLSAPSARTPPMSATSRLQPLVP
jgi:superfamily II DNA/RNA helicase